MSGLRVLVAGSLSLESSSLCKPVIVRGMDMQIDDALELRESARRPQGEEHRSYHHYHHYHHLKSPAFTIRR